MNLLKECKTSQSHQKLGLFKCRSQLLKQNIGYIFMKSTFFNDFYPFKYAGSRFPRFLSVLFSLTQKHYTF